MVKQIKIYLIFTAVIVISLLLIFSLYNILKKSNIIGDPSTATDTDANSFIQNPIGETPTDSDSSSSSSSLGGGGSSGGGGSGGGSGGSDSSTPPEDVYVSPFAEIIKPQNNPSVDVALNYLNSQGASIKIINTIGEDSSVLVRLADCPPEISQDIAADEEKDFVFSCTTQENYFDHDLFITYTYSTPEPITVYGVVRGTIS